MNNKAAWQVFPSLLLWGHSPKSQNGWESAASQPERYWKPDSCNNGGGQLTLTPQRREEAEAEQTKPQ